MIGPTPRSTPSAAPTISLVGRTDKLNEMIDEFLADL